MVLKIFNRILIVALVLTMSMTSSCEKEFLVFVNCSQCLPEEPEFANIRIRVLIDPSITTAPLINVYEGTGTEGRLIYSYKQMNETSNSVEVALNRTYTFEAIYYAGSTVVRCIDSVRPSVKYTKSDCDEPCFYIYNNKVDLRLKYL